MMVEQSLLDLLSIQMKCEYLSDLRFLSLEQRRYLALNYLTGAPPEDTAQAAKARLIDSLSQPCEAR